MCQVSSKASAGQVFGPYPQSCNLDGSICFPTHICEQIYIQKCAHVLETLPHTTGTAASPQQRRSRYGFRGAYQTTDPHWGDPEKEATFIIILYVLTKD